MVVSVLEGAGRQEVRHFASHITAADGFQPDAMAHFSFNANKSFPARGSDAKLVDYIGLERDPLSAIKSSGGESMRIWDYAVSPETPNLNTKP